MIDEKIIHSNNKKIKVLYIAGTARSGSTFLGNILSDGKDFINVGELRYIWDRGIIENWQCTCHNNFAYCSFWKKITTSLSHKNKNLSKICNDISERSFKKIRIRNLIFNSAKKIKKTISDNKEYNTILSDLYMDIKSYSKNAYILDSSKDAIYAEYLSQLTNIELYIIHIVRDPRSVIYSQVYNRKVQSIDQKRSFIMGTSFFKSLSSWYIQNYLIEKLHAKKENYFFIKYEDIGTEGKQNKTKDVYNKIKNWGFVSNENAKQDHAFSGNPVRFTENKELIFTKSNNTENNSWYIKFMIKLMTFPGRIKYRY